MAELTNPKHEQAEIEAFEQARLSRLGSNFFDELENAVATNAESSDQLERLGDVRAALKSYAESVAGPSAAFKQAGEALTTATEQRLKVENKTSTSAEEASKLYYDAVARQTEIGRQIMMDPKYAPLKKKLGDPGLANIETTSGIYDWRLQRAAKATPGSWDAQLDRHQIAERDIMLQYITAGREADRWKAVRTAAEEASVALPKALEQEAAQKEAYDASLKALLGAQQSGSKAIRDSVAAIGVQEATALATPENLASKFYEYDNNGKQPDGAGGLSLPAALRMNRLSQSERDFNRLIKDEMITRLNDALKAGDEEKAANLRKAYGDFHESAASGQISDLIPAYEQMSLEYGRGEQNHNRILRHPQVLRTEEQLVNDAVDEIISRDGIRNPQHIESAVAPEKLPEPPVPPVSALDFRNKQAPKATAAPKQEPAAPPTPKEQFARQEAAAEVLLKRAETEHMRRTYQGADPVGAMNAAVNAYAALGAQFLQDTKGIQLSDKDRATLEANIRDSFRSHHSEEAKKFSYGNGPLVSAHAKWEYEHFIKKDPESYYTLIPAQAAPAATMQQSQTTSTAKPQQAPAVEKPAAAADEILRKQKKVLVDGMKGQWFGKEEDYQATVTYFSAGDGAKFLKTDEGKKFIAEVGDELNKLKPGEGITSRKKDVGTLLGLAPKPAVTPVEMPAPEAAASAPRPKPEPKPITVEMRPADAAPVEAKSEVAASAAITPDKAKLDAAAEIAKELNQLSMFGGIKYAIADVDENGQVIEALRDQRTARRERMIGALDGNMDGVRDGKVSAEELNNAAKLAGLEGKLDAAKLANILNTASMKTPLPSENTDQQPETPPPTPSAPQGAGRRK
ncbi:MAG: hypothetical protein SFX19_02430 [Alphaproteobacteria bacterium]|nr:hypothetical protein [Alphaproteobacteria bacterium]